METSIGSNLSNEEVKLEVVFRTKKIIDILRAKNTTWCAKILIWYSKNDDDSHQAMSKY